MKFNGIIPAFITPLYDDNTINEDVARKLIEAKIVDGADGFYICGATGEGIVMQKEERKILCEIAVDAVAKRKPVIAHIAAIDFTSTVELAKHAEKAGADCIASIPPFYFPYEKDEIYNFYKSLAKEVHIPVMIYYLPMGGVYLDAETVAKIYEIDNVTAVKWSSSNYFEMMKVKQLTHGEMNIINGPDETLICGLAAGADGAIGSTYNMMLPLYKQLLKAFNDGDMNKATEIQYKANSVTTKLMNHSVLPAIKHCLETIGFEVGNATYPMRWLSDEEKSIINAEMKEVGWPFK